MRAKEYTIKLTDAQVEAVNSAFVDGLDFSNKLRSLVASGLALYQIEFPPTPAHGGKRKGAGRKKALK